MHDVTKCPCFTHHLLQSIPQSAEIETKYTGLQKKKKKKKSQKRTGTGLKVLTPNKLLTRFPIVLAQIKAGDNS